jgi:hypothetical protein
MNLDLKRLQEISKLKMKHNETLEIEKKIGVNKHELNKSGDFHTKFANLKEKREFYERNSPKKLLFEKLSDPNYVKIKNFHGKKQLKNLL